MMNLRGVMGTETGDLLTVRALDPIPMIKEFRMRSNLDDEGRPMSLLDAKILSENLRHAGYLLVKIEDVTEDGKVINPYGY
jgi:hypothetical protein